MIFNEILKKIRQIEIRTNRIVTELTAGSRASARFTARATEASKTNSSPNSSRTLKRRKRRVPKLHALRLDLRLQPRSFLSLTPGFSPVAGEGERFNRFSGFPPAQKPLKRLDYRGRVHTGLKPGVNETGSLGGNSSLILRPLSFA
jgi:hypothetical protein